MRPVSIKLPAIFLFVVLLLISPSCDKASSNIPDVPVLLEINLDLHNELRVPGNSTFFRGGYGGIIVYCEDNGYYYAFDAACTNEISPSCHLDISGISATCPCCQSQFILLGGYISKGPATAPLKQYKTNLLGNVLRVYN